MTSKTRSAKGQRRARPARPARVRSVLDLRPDPTNRRKHTARNVDMVVDSLRAVGAARSIVIDEDNIVRAGNGLIEAAAQAGIHKVRVVDVDGDTIVAVRRSGLTANQKRDLAIYDNRTAELAEWNPAQLAADQLAGADLTPFFFDTELAAILRSPASGGGVEGGAPQFVIVVTCATEAEQTTLLERFIREGLSCRAVVS